MYTELLKIEKSVIYRFQKSLSFTSDRRMLIISGRSAVLFYFFAGDLKIY